MSEHVQISGDEKRVNASHAMEGIAKQYPEIEDLQNAEVVNAVETLVAEFSIKPEFFTDPGGNARALVLASVAANLVQFEHSGMNARANPADYEFISDTVLQVGLKYVSGFDDVVREATVAMHGEVSDGQKIRAIEKYKSHELTKALSESIARRGLLDEPREVMGITDEIEEDFELVVLSISESDDVYHFSPQVTFPESREYEADRGAAREKERLATQELEDAERWRSGLVQRREAFLREAGVPFVGPVFVEHLNGKRYLCMSADVAERLIDQIETRERSADYDEYAYSGDLAYLQHEYVHTQGGIADMETYIGIALEEVRAEQFSGNRQGYMDVQLFVQDLGLVTGLDLVEQMRGRVKGGTSEELFVDIATVSGLHNLSRILGVIPRNYLEGGSSVFQQNIIHYLGGTEGVIERLYSETVDRLGVAKVEQLGQRVVDISREASDPDFILRYRDRFSKFGTNLIRRRLGTETVPKTE